MTHATDIATLAQWMAADFSNQAQAFKNPPFFAHIRVCMRPLPAGLLPGTSFLVEQAYHYMLHQKARPGQQTGRQRAHANADVGEKGRIF
jgi:hypothetical protein